MKNGIEKVKSDPTRKSLYLFLVLFTFYLFLFSFSEASAATIGRPMNNDGLVIYWDMDVVSGDGTFFQDRSGNRKHGTLANATGTENWVDGKIGGGAEFDGVNDFAYVLYDPVNTSQTMSVWVKVLVGVDAESVLGFSADIPDVGSHDREISINGNNGGTVRYRVYDGSSQVVVSTDTVGDNEWHHIVARYEEGAGISIFVDGVKQGATLAIGNLFNYTGSVYFTAGMNADVREYFGGSLDEIRFYERALSDDEIRRLYNFNAPTLGKTPTVISDGLVGHWTFDGTDMSGNNAFDVSGRENTGTLAGSPTRTNGIIGQALEFDGVDDSVLLGSLSSTAQTYTFTTWFYTPGCSDELCYLFDSETGRLILATKNNSGGDQISYFDGTWHSFGTTPTSTWSHVAFVMEGGVGGEVYLNGVSLGTDTYIAKDLGNSIRLGSHYSGTAYNFEGKMDDTRLYDRALSADEIQHLYGATKPATASKPQLDDGLVAYYSFDFATDGTTVYDRSGERNHGTLTNATGTENWVDGVAGGGAVDFDGINDHVLTSDFDYGDSSTIAFWFQSDDLTGAAYQYIYSHGNFQAANSVNIYLHELSAGFPTLRTNLRDGVDGLGAELLDVSEDVSDGAWYHYALRIDSSGSEVFINGNSRATSVQGGASFNPSADLFLGGRNDLNADRFFPGRMDDVRIYNRALSAEEIRRLYQMGL